MIAVNDLKRTDRITWAAGDYAAVAEHIDDVPPRDLIARAAIETPLEVLDVATGTGNIALRAAALGASVVGRPDSRAVGSRAPARRRALCGGRVAGGRRRAARPVRRRTRERLTGEGRWAACRAELVALAERHKRVTRGLHMEAEYVVTVARSA